MFHKTGGNMSGAGSIKPNYKPEIPEGTTHIWTPAVEKEVIGMGWHRRAFYRVVDDVWQSYSRVHEGWCKSANDSDWFNKETKEGYFITLDQFKHPEFVMKPEKM